MCRTQSALPGVVLSQSAGSHQAAELHHEPLQHSFSVSFKKNNCARISIFCECDSFVSVLSWSLTDVFPRLSRRQMKWGEFIILNMVLTSMVSRLW